MHEQKVTQMVFAVIITDWFYQRAGLHGRLRSEVCNAAVEGQACVGVKGCVEPPTSTIPIISKNNLYGLDLS